MAEAPLVDKWSKTFIKNEDGTYTLRCSLIVGDIQIGAVEIKDKDGDSRATVDSDGLNVSVKKSVLPIGAATSTKQDEIVFAIESIPTPDVSTLATHAKQDDIIANQTNGTQVAQIQEKEPTDTTHLNPSLFITESVLGTVTTTTIQKTIGGDVYQQTIKEDSSNNSVTVSSWSEL